MRAAVFPVVGVLAVVAVAFGLQLGDSAISNINPHYFRGAAPIARDVTANLHAPEPLYAQASGWQQGYEAMAHDCGADCPAWQARHGSLPASVGAPVDPQPLPSAAVAEPPPLEMASVPAEADIAPAGRMNRYLHYPVSQDQEAIAASVSAEGTPAPAESPSGEPEGM